MKTWLQLGRVSNLPTVWTNVLAGILLAGGTARPALVVTLAAAMSFFYVGGMFLNDAFDQKFDAKLRPDRPIPSGKISAAEVYAIGFGLLLAGMAVLVAEAFLLGGRHSWSPLGGGAALGGAVVAYDAWHKHNPLSPLLMGLCRVLVYVTAALAVAPAVGMNVLGGSAVLLAYLIGLTFIAKQENLAQLRNLWPLAFLLVPFVYCASFALHSVVGAVLYAALLGWVGFSVLLVRKRKIGQAVVLLIAGISLLDALLIAGAQPDAAPAVIAALAVGATLFLQRWVKGT
jgi:4-hydroxybenzoate polyprenyltransferase